MSRQYTAPGRNSWQRRDVEDIVMWACRLIRSPGYCRADITSSLLRRCMPSGRTIDTARIRHALTSARLDEQTFDYILHSLRADYQAACAAAA